MLANDCNVGAKNISHQEYCCYHTLKKPLWPLSPSTTSTWFVISISSKFAADCSSWMDFLLYVEFKWFANWGICKGFELCQLHSIACLILFTFMRTRRFFACIHCEWTLSLSFIQLAFISSQLFQIFWIMVWKLKFWTPKNGTCVT